MTSEPRAVLIITLQRLDDIEGTKRRISKIGGVTSVEFNHLTRKLLVRSRGEAATVRKIEREVKKMLKDGWKNDEEHAVSSAKKKPTG